MMLYVCMYRNWRGNMKTPFTISSPSMPWNNNNNDKEMDTLKLDQNAMLPNRGQIDGWSNQWPIW